MIHKKIQQLEQYLLYAFAHSFLDLEAKILVYKQDCASINCSNEVPVQFEVSLKPHNSNLQDHSNAANSSFAVVFLLDMLLFRERFFLRAKKNFTYEAATFL